MLMTSISMKINNMRIKVLNHTKSMKGPHNLLLLQDRTSHNLPNRVEKEGLSSEAKDRQDQEPEELPQWTLKLARKLLVKEALPYPGISNTWLKLDVKEGKVSQKIENTWPKLDVREEQHQEVIDKASLIP
jgi:hypothetical protein